MIMMVILVIHVTDGDGGGATVGDCGRYMYGKGDVDCGYDYV